jgi:predicted Zn-dependent protease
MIAASIVVPYSAAGYGALQGANALIPLGFLKFSRSMEREADYLGLQYLYKAGYDPTAFVDFFEKIESLEKRKPGTVAKVFSTHPMTDDRIQATQTEIQKVLVARPEYLVNTSEFNDMKARLEMLHNRRKPESEGSNRPRLRRAPGAGAGTGDDSGQKPDSDERPTLKRRADQ